jgi:hypothetical protein
MISLCQDNQFDNHNTVIVGFEFPADPIEINLSDVKSQVPPAKDESLSLPPSTTSGGYEVVTVLLTPSWCRKGTLCRTPGSVTGFTYCLSIIQWRSVSPTARRLVAETLSGRSWEVCQ